MPFYRRLRGQLLAQGAPRGESVISWDCSVVMRPHAHGSYITYMQQHKQTHHYVPKTTRAVAGVVTTEVRTAWDKIATALWRFGRRSYKFLQDNPGVWLKHTMRTGAITFYDTLRDADVLNVHWLCLCLTSEEYHALSPSQRDARACAVGYVPAALCLFSWTVQLTLVWAVLIAGVGALVLAGRSLCRGIRRCVDAWAVACAFVHRLGRRACAAIAAAHESISDWMRRACDHVFVAFVAAWSRANTRFMNVATKSMCPARRREEVNVLSYIKWVENRCEYYGLDEDAEMAQDVYKQVEALIKENKEYKRKMEVFDREFHYMTGSV